MTQLLILGGGPAGCAAAIFARSQGLLVKVIDVPKRSRRLPGETVHPGVEPLLKQLGIWETVLSCGFHRHTGIWRVGLNGDRHFDEYGRDQTGAWRGFQLDRVLFHKILRERAIRLGVEWVEAKPIGLSGDGSQGWSIETSTGQFINANTLVDATGRRAWLADQLGLVPEITGEVNRVQFGWSPRKEHTGDSNPLFIPIENGWDWFAPISDKEVAWVKQRNGNNNRGLDLTPRIFRNCAGTNWFLVGDAACLTTPASGNGTLRSLMSGIFAAHLAVAVFSRQIKCGVAAEEYCSWISDFWESSVAETSFSTSSQSIKSVGV